MLLSVWLGIITVLSVIPLSQPKTEMPVDKIEHAVAYGIAAILFFRVLRRRTTLYRAAAFSILAAAAYGAGIECVQYFLPHRTFSPGDLAANLAGAVVFCLPYSLWERR